jgi:hypothetical protein
MNPNTPKNWTLNTYTNSTWTNLVDEESIVANLSIANTTGGALNVSVRLSDGSGNNLAVIVPTNAIEAGDAYRVDLRAVAVTGAQTLQVWASGAGVNFLASGAVEGV